MRVVRIEVGVENVELGECKGGRNEHYMFASTCQKFTGIGRGPRREIFKKTRSAATEQCWPLSRHLRKTGVNLGDVT